MHIAYLTPEYPDSRRPDGGLGNYIRKVSLELIRRGHEATAFVLSYENKSWNDQDIRVLQLNSFRFHWRLRRNRSLSRWLDLCERWINGKRLKLFVLQSHRRKKIDLVQTSNYLAPGIELCRNGQFPLVCRCSSYMPPLRAANGQQRTIKSTIEDWREISTMLKADAVFAPSAYVANLYDRFEAIKPRVIRTPIENTPSGSDESVYQAWLNGKKYLLHFGTLMGVKGTDLLIQIAPRLLDQFPDLHLAFVGADGPLPNGENTSVFLNKELGAYKDRVLLHPPLQKPQLTPVIRHAYGVVMPSRIDNYPNACLEALALGVPVIGTYESSLEEIITDRKTGFLARNNNPESLHEETMRLLTLPEDEYRQMKENIRQFIDTELATDRVGQLIQFYEDTIANFRPYA